MRFNFSFLSRMKMRTKAYLVVVLILMLAGVGTFGVLIKTGKLGSKADSNIKTVTVSGTTKDSVTGAVIADTDIFIGAEGADTVRTKSNTNGYFFAQITVDYNNPMQQAVWIRYSKIGYPSGEGSSVEKVLPQATSSIISVSQNFSFSKIEEDTTPAPSDPVSDRCKTPPPGPDDYYSSYHQGSYYGEEIHDVLFCTHYVQSYLIINYRNRLAENADQLNYLSGQTAVAVPVVYIVPEIYWDKEKPAGYAEFGGKEIVVDKFYLDTVSTVTHEFGHIVDWVKGWDQQISNSSRCVPNTGYTLEHCYSTYQSDFVYAASISGKNTITGYALSDNREMFAEIFTSHFLPYDDFSEREKLKYAISNIMFGGYKLPINEGLSYINASKNTYGHNAAMYVYKYVMRKSNQDEFFPGTIDRYTYNQIWYGKYMPTGVVSLNLTDHAGFKMANTDVSVGGSSKTTRQWRGFGVFPDGSGDLFTDITGTAVIMEASVGADKIVDVVIPSYYQGAGWLGQKTNVNQGSNSVINLGFKQHFDPIKPNPMPAGSTLSDTSKMISKTITGRIVTPLVKSAENMKRYPDLGGPANAPTPFFVVGGSGERDEEHTLNLKWGTMGTYTIKNTFINMKTIADYDDQRAYGPVNKTCTRDYSKPGGKNLYGQIAPYTATPAGCY